MNRHFFRCVAAMLLSFSAVASAYAQSDNSRVMMVLDGSNSMWGQIDGVAKITIAKQVMTDLITTWDDGVDMGLMVYGHRRKDDCSDIEVVAMPGPVDRATLIDKVQSISPKGKTPITDSMLLAAATVGYYTGDNASVVLVSDGLETCEADPCAQARSFEVVNPGFDVHVIGFDVTDEELAALQCIATETGGQFYSASTAGELLSALRATVAATPAPAPVPATSEPAEPKASQFLYAKLCETCERLNPLDVSWNVYKDGQPFYDGLGVVFPDDPVFEAGTYEVAVRFKSTHVTAKGEIEFGEDGKQIGALNLNGGSAVMFAYATDDKTIAADPILYEFFEIGADGPASEALTEAASSNADTYLPAGRYLVRATHQDISETAEIEIVAGQATEYAFDMRIGFLLPKAVLSAQGAPATGIDYEVYRTQADADAGSGRVSFMVGERNAPEALRAGDYVIKALLDYGNRPPISVLRTFPVTIRGNETATPTLDMQAGLLSHEIANETGKSLLNIDYVRESDGKRAAYYNLGGSHTLALAEGRYFLRAMISGGQTFDSDPFDITAGQTTNVKVTLR
ncbi:vWA domain-containing protein [Oricola indica]|uniref:vWA domain-containing protein n=1 Tax=Oricola indica TaxID=2872591 RepID=UPI003CCC250B